MMLREEVKGIGIGLLLMSVFTFIWSSIGNAGLEGRDKHMLLIIFYLLCVLFIFNAIRAFCMLGKFPISSSEKDLKEKKKISKWFGIIFGLEGVTIPVAVNIVIRMGISGSDTAHHCVDCRPSFLSDGMGI